MKYFLMPHPPIIIPEIGKGREEEVIKTVNSCKEVGDIIEESEVETIIIISPHGTVFRDAISLIKTDYIYGDLGDFGAPEVKFNYYIDLELTDEIINLSVNEEIPVVSLDEKSSIRYRVPLELDHGAMVPLYYADKNKKHKLVHINYGLLTPIELFKFGLVIKQAVNNTGRKAVIIASGDLSHRLIENGPYPYTPVGKEFDDELVKILSLGEVEKIFKIDRDLIKSAGECGLRSIYILLGTINSSKTNSKLFSYGGSLGVGYAVFQFEEGSGNLYEDLMNEKEKEHKRKLEEENPYTRLARKNLDTYFNSGRLLTREEIEDEKLLGDKKGVFVSLKMNGELRGCIGTIKPTTDSVGEEIIRNSLSAALNDPRFAPLKKEELMEIDISVDLLYPPEEAVFEDLDPYNYGVIVTSGNKKGLLLPNLEEVYNKEEQLEIAMNKGGISHSDKYTLERFKVERFKEV
ncbi:AmmeMemoRadiSam system protein A [Clostridium sp. LIBA-8841]|uniref:AmmeMemoRadiSam system protein A n=1 Tax=Clostridium sp. LIBA-8841 TaxID=2987530 RepID=UPI002AC4621F|nr:AmmeMemoRadiSam system protein A [Clostridium sp. LIBA-8841]MDZ5253512.1 AmmeMemoRadiSam system protein A [Clostridium sp. LIBA-8841]